MKIINNFLKNIQLIQLKSHIDDRGNFLKIYSQKEFKKLEINFIIKESFISLSNKGVIRGMHYDILSAKNNKIIHCYKGKIFDVILDIRKSSPTYGKFITIYLEENDNKLIYIPSGFAHGFLALKNATQVFYFSSAINKSENERGILWNSFGCKWPINNSKIILSKRDKIHKKLYK